MTSMNGWIKIHRRLSDNPIWTCEPFTRGQAWIDLLMLANYEDSFFYVRNIKVDVKRGQIAWSEPKLAGRWKWSRTKLRKFLKDLEKEQQLIQQKNNVTQIITITNYEEYQNKEQQEDSRKTARRRIKESKEDKERDSKNFYEFEKTNANDNNYNFLVDFLYGKNEWEKPLDSVLKIPDQLTYKQFQKLYNKSKEKNKKLSNLILSLENHRNVGTYKSFYLTLNAWLNRD